MNFRVWLKIKAADRVLAPVREELIAAITPGASLLDVGCGTGDLLFRAAPKLSHGLGVDLDQAMIKFARKKKLSGDFSHLDFTCNNALNMTTQAFDFSSSTLCLHEMTADDACQLLDFMLNNSDTVLIADFTTAGTWSGRLGIEIDELFSGHYLNYKKYMKAGELPAYVKRTGGNIQNVTNSGIDGIAIWKIQKQR